MCRVRLLYAAQPHSLVGYNNAKVRAGSKMIGASFKAIGSDAGIDLTTMVPQGYEKAMELDEDVAEFIKETNYGIGGCFLVTIYGANGGAEKATKGGKIVRKLFSYEREHDGDDWVDAEGKWVWLDIMGDNTVVKDEVVFNTGDGVLFEVSPDLYGANIPENFYALSNAGEALTAPRSAKVRAGSKVIVPPLSAAVDLTDMEPQGYEEAMALDEDVAAFIKETNYGIGGCFLATIYGANGGAEKAIKGGKQVRKLFSYEREHDGDDWVDAEGKWVWLDIMGDNTVVKDEVVFNPGEAMLFEVSPDLYGANISDDFYIVSFPGIDDLAK